MFSNSGAKSRDLEARIGVKRAARRRSSRALEQVLREIEQKTAERSKAK
jgi:hypothetical protein